MNGSQGLVIERLEKRAKELDSENNEAFYLLTKIVGAPNVCGHCFPEAEALVLKMKRRRVS